MSTKSLVFPEGGVGGGKEDDDNVLLVSGLLSAALLYRLPL